MTLTKFDTVNSHNKFFYSTHIYPFDLFLSGLISLGAGGYIKAFILL